MTGSKKVLVFSIALEGFERKFSNCIKSQIHYCQKYNYQYLLVRDTPYKLYPHEAAWLKVPLLLAALAMGYEWVLFLDADCEIRPHTPEFTHYLGNLSESHTIFMAPGFSGRINSGVIFVKNRSETISFLRTILDQADSEIPDPADVAPYENGHFIFWGKRNQSLYLLEHDLWNNNSRFDTSCYIQHYSRGKIRDSYLESQTNAKVQLMELLDSVPRLLLKTSRRENGQKASANDTVISQSMKKLLSFYTKKHSGFFINIYDTGD